MTREDIHEFIVKSEYNEVFEFLRSQEKDHSWKAQLTLLEGQFKSFLRNRRNGILSAGESVRKENELRMHLLELADSFFVPQTSDGGNYGSNITTPPTITFSPAFWKMAFLIVGLAVIALLWINIKSPLSSSGEAEKTDQTVPANSVTIQKTVQPNSQLNSSSTLPSTSRPKPNRTVANQLQVTSNPADLQPYFSTAAGKLLNIAHISYQQQAEGSVRKILCAFDLKKNKTRSGVRDAFQCTLSLNIRVLRPDGSVCSTQTYSSVKSRISYPEDSEDDIRNKVIEPALAELESNFQERPPELCDIQ